VRRVWRNVTLVGVIVLALLLGALAVIHRDRAARWDSERSLTYRQAVRRMPGRVDLPSSAHDIYFHYSLRPDSLWRNLGPSDGFYLRYSTDSAGAESAIAARMSRDMMEPKGSVLVCLWPKEPISEDNLRFAPDIRRLGHKWWEPMTIRSGYWRGCNLDRYRGRPQFWVDTLNWVVYQNE
jgi:hypothetical protein